VTTAVAAVYDRRCGSASTLRKGGLRAPPQRSKRCAAVTRIGRGHTANESTIRFSKHSVLPERRGQSLSDEADFPANFC